MKKINLLIVTLLALSLFWGCGKAQPEQPETAPKTETQTDEKTPSEETEEETPAEKPEKEYPDVIETATATGYLTPESIETNTPCQVRLFKEQQSGEAYCHLFLEVTFGEKVLKKDLTECISPVLPDKLYSADIDGDGIQEILIHHDTGGCGGYGIYISWVLKVEQEDLRVLFSSDMFPKFDTGFESRFLEGYKLEVTNRITDYKLVLDVKESHRKYLEQAGKLPTFKFWVDPFYEFIPEDVDNDGISEIVCKQYTCILDHADYTGTACSVLKFNTDAQSFEVIDAWFEPYIEE